MINQKYFLTFAVLILSMSSVLAIGVTVPYWDERPLVMAPGESKTIQFELQNMVGDSDTTLRAALVQGSEIASFTDENLDYFVPFNTKDTKVNMLIEIPSNADQGTNYTVGTSFTTVTNSESGQFQLGSAFEQYFEVQVQGKPVGFPKMYIYIIAAIVIIGIVTIILRRKK